MILAVCCGDRRRSVSRPWRPSPVPAATGGSLQDPPGLSRSQRRSHRRPFRREVRQVASTAVVTRCIASKPGARVRASCWAAKPSLECRPDATGIRATSKEPAASARHGRPDRDPADAGAGRARSQMPLDGTRSSGLRSSPSSLRSVGSSSITQPQGQACTDPFTAGITHCRAMAWFAILDSPLRHILAALPDLANFSRALANLHRTVASRRPRSRATSEEEKPSRSRRTRIVR